MYVWDKVGERRFLAGLGKDETEARTAEYGFEVIMKQALDLH